MSNVQKARIEEKACPMFDAACALRVAEHVASFMTQPFSVEQAKQLIEEKCGRYVKGKHKGELRGYAYLRVCTVGGWKFNGPGQGNGFVAYPGKLYGLTIADFDGHPYLAVGLTNI